MNRESNLLFAWVAVFCCCALILSTACSRAPQPIAPKATASAAKRYNFKGKVVAVDQKAASVDIDNEPIPDFMDSMVMPYTVKPPAVVDQLQPGDSIAADVVVADPGNYWLENVKVTGHKAPGKSADTK